MDLKKILNDRILIFDGAMGTMLQQSGLKPGELPELLNLENPAIVEKIHRAYVEAGADVVSANTFQAHELKLGKKNSVEDVVSAGIDCARRSGATYVALDVGPLGQLLEPMGTISFETAYNVFKRQMIAGENAGADLIIIETVSDPYEAKAAVLAAKENTSLPVICTMTFQEDGRTFVGCDPLTATILLQGLGVDALGVNCSVGPEALSPIVRTMLQYAKVPVVMQANAGMPVIRGDKTHYHLSAEEYVTEVMALVRQGVKIVGGCCGTTPAHIRMLKEQTTLLRPVCPDSTIITACTSGTKTVVFDGALIEIGERLNPTGKKKMQQALRDGDNAFIIDEAIAQTEAGARVLDVNVGLPDIDEPAVLVKTIKTVQGVTNAPIQIDSADPSALNAAARIYNGCPIINSLNGKQDVMDAVFPIAKKYGALIVCLTLDENGIPPTANGRLAIARRIRDVARDYEIPDENLLIDCLVLTASAQQSQVKETLLAIRMVKAELGLKTVLGVSNVSFGLPKRELINSTFLSAAYGAGLDAAIINPLSPEYRRVLDAIRVLNNEDKNAVAYIEKYANSEIDTIAAAVSPTHCATAKAAAAGTATGGLTLFEIISQGRKDQTAAKVEELLLNSPPLDIVNNEFIPALNSVGQRFEKGELFLPQLMLCAQAVQNGFTVIKARMLSTGEKGQSGEKILLATVQGDIHDIGKNIVKMLLENYGFDVIDLGKDVPIERVVSAAKDHDVRLIGLSSLMTTTVKSMKETIAAVRDAKLDCAFLVGGAVLNEEYAKFVGAEYYAKDAMDGVAIANRFFNNG